MAVDFERAVPVFRIFSLEKAREFYLDFLGFKVEWEHRFAPDAPVFMQVSRGGLAINLSEHHGRRHARFARLCVHERRAGLASRAQRQELPA
jgi:catechol 2,3-dioxygenase-like lactoylglutathione lyase family enzyme